jgi:hypothetical protein
VSSGLKTHWGDEFGDPLLRPKPEAFVNRLLLTRHALDKCRELIAAQDLPVNEDIPCWKRPERFDLERTFRGAIGLFLQTREVYKSDETKEILTQMLMRGISLKMDVSLTLLREPSTVEERKRRRLHKE